MISFGLSKPGGMCMSSLCNKEERKLFDEREKKECGAVNDVRAC